MLSWLLFIRDCKTKKISGKKIARAPAHAFICRRWAVRHNGDAGLNDGKGEIHKYISAPGLKYRMQKGMLIHLA